MPWILFTNALIYLIKNEEIKDDEKLILKSI